MQSDLYNLITHKGLVDESDFIKKSLYSILINGVITLQMLHTLIL